MMHLKRIGAAILVWGALGITPGQAALYDMVEMTVNGAPGTGPITLGSAILPYISAAAAGIPTGDKVSYQIRDGNNWEVGRSVYTSVGTVLSRGSSSCSTSPPPCIASSTNSNNAIPAGANSVVWIAALAEDLVSTLYPSSVLTQVDQPICTLTDAATVLSDAKVCLTNATKGTGYQAVTLTAARTLGLPSSLRATGGQSILYMITHSGSSDGPTLATGFEYPGGGQPPECNGSTITVNCWSVGTQTDWVPCVSIDATHIGCAAVLTNMASVLAVPSVTASTAGTFTENPPASTASVVQQLTAGGILIVAESNYNATPVSISTIVDSTQAGNISGCTQFIGLAAVSSAFSLYHCAIASTLTGGGNDTITATWSGTGQGYGLITAVVQNALANASLDDGIGAGSSTTITTGATSQADLLLCATYAQSISPIITGVTYNSGWTALQFGSDSNFATLGLASQTQTVAGTATCSATWSGTPQFASNVEVVGIK